MDAAWIWIFLGAFALLFLVKRLNDNSKKNLSYEDKTTATAPKKTGKPKRTGNTGKNTKINFMGKVIKIVIPKPTREDLEDLEVWIKIHLDERNHALNPLKHVITHNTRDLYPPGTLCSLALTICKETPWPGPIEKGAGKIKTISRKEINEKGHIYAEGASESNAYTISAVFKPKGRKVDFELETPDGILDKGSAYIYDHETQIPFWYHNVGKDIIDWISAEDKKTKNAK